MCSAFAPDYGRYTPVPAAKRVGNYGNCPAVQTPTSGIWNENLAQNGDPKQFLTSFAH